MSAAANSEDAKVVETKVVDAALRVVSRQGVGRWSMADVAREAGCSRATVYRLFPGGRAALLDGLGRRELLRFFGSVSEAIEREDDTESALTAALTTAARGMRDHAAFQRLLAEEPGLLLPYLGFNQVDRLYRAASAAAAPHLVRFVGPEHASWAGEWMARLLLSFVFSPDAAIDLTDADHARRLVRGFLIPALTPSGSTVATPRSS